MWRVCIVQILVVHCGTASVTIGARCDSFAGGNHLSLTPILCF